MTGVGAAPVRCGFIKLSHDVVDSAEFAEASSGATRLLILLWRRHNGRNNGKIHCSVREAASWLHCGKSKALACLTELQRLGLIAAAQKGHFDIKAGELKNISTSWRLLFLVDREDGSE